MKILLAIDDSKCSEAAAQALIQQMRRENVEVCVFHVVVPLIIVPYSHMGELQTLQAEQLERLKEGKELAERTAEKLRVAGFKAQAGTDEGDPRTAIIDKAAEWSADLIFMGSHGRTGIDRFLIGSVSNAVLRHAFCSVEIVRPPSTKSAQRP